MSLRNSENVWVLALFLGITGLLAALILAVVSDLTAEPIRQAKMKNELRMFRELNLPDFDNNITENVFNSSNVKFMAAAREGKIVGLVAETFTKRGYNGKMRALISFDVSGNILAVQIVEHNETPGLGAAVCERKFRKTLFNLFKPTPQGLPPNGVLDQFNGKNAAGGGNWKISKDGGTLAYRTGATISCRAVTEMVNKAAAGFKSAYDHFSKGTGR